MFAKNSTTPTMREARATLAPLSVCKPQGLGRPADLCGIREAAARAGMNEYTLWKLVRQGKLRAWGRVGALRISLDDLLAPYEPKSQQ